MEHERIYIVKGIARHFTGDVEITFLGVRKEEDKARRLGACWAKDVNEQMHNEGKNVHASYEIISTLLL